MGSGEIPNAIERGGGGFGRRRGLREPRRERRRRGGRRRRGSRRSSVKNRVGIQGIPIQRVALNTEGKKGVLPQQIHG